VKSSGVEAEGRRDAQEVVRRRSGLAVDVAIELLAVQPDLPAEL
jgi:hypothetical protein